MQGCLRILDNKKKRHDKAVGKIYDELDSLMMGEEMFYDALLREVQYFANDVEYNNGGPRGELDIGLIDWEGKEMRYIEVKTTEKGVSKARKQLTRAREFFDMRGYEFIGDVYIVDETEYRSSFVTSENTTGQQLPVLGERGYY